MSNCLNTALEKMKMKKRNINLVLFSLFLAFLISLPILCVDRYMSHPDYPWQLVPFGADSLSQHYKERYVQLKPDAIMRSLQDTAKPLVMVLVDGWGVPYDENLLEGDFAHFTGKNVSFAVHKRLLQHTSHAEAVEYKQGFSKGVFLEIGDSSACAKKRQEQSSHFKQTICCEKCNETRAAATLDSLISLVNDSTWNSVAWTIRETREGDRDKLQSLLKNLSEIAIKHPDVQFVIQGTHRPLLGTPETRRKHLAPWVPVVLINCSLSGSASK